MKKTIFVIGVSICLTALAQSNKNTVSVKSKRSVVSQPVVVVPPQPPELSKFMPVAWKDDLPFTAYNSNKPDKFYEYIKILHAKYSSEIDEFTSKLERAQASEKLGEELGDNKRIAMAYKCVGGYDAEKQRYTVAHFVSYFSNTNEVVDGLNAKELWALNMDLESNRTVLSTYIGQNAYGAQSEISKIEVGKYSVAFTKASLDSVPEIFPSKAHIFTNISFTYDMDWRNFDNHVELPSEEARKVKGNLLCLIVIDLNAPYIFNYKGRYPPKLNDPTDVSVKGFGFYGDFVSHSVFDSQTGRVYTTKKR